MVIAALISFGILLVAWIFAPNGGTPQTAPASSREPVPMTTALTRFGNRTAAGRR